jgi:hypothetical protein
VSAEGGVTKSVNP